MSWRGRWVVAALVAGRMSAAGAVGNLERTLSGDGFGVEAVRAHEFIDLDRDGVKEILVHGDGGVAGPAPADLLLKPLDGASTDAGGVAILAGAPPAPGAFVGVFRFQRGSFRWSPVLVAPYDPDRCRIHSFRSLRFGDDDLVRLTYQVGERVEDHLFRITAKGVETVLRVARGPRPGEGFWPRGRKVLTSRGLPDPFAPDPRRPGLLCRVRYRWDGTRLVPEHWTLTGYGFRADLPFPAIPTWSRRRVTRPAVARRAWDLQRAAERGVGRERFDLADLARKRHGESAAVVYERDGFGVVTHAVTGEPRAEQYFQPFRANRERGAAAWIGLRELEGLGPEAGPTGR